MYARSTLSKVTLLGGSMMRKDGAKEEMYVID